MKKTIMALAAIVAGWLTVEAQVAIALELNRDTYLQYEQIYAKVTMRNDSGQPLVFGESEGVKGFLNFQITDPAGRIHTITDETANLLKGKILRDGQTQEIVIPIQSFFRLSQLGDYRIYAWVNHQSLNSEFKSPDVTFKISPGVVMWERTVGVPDLTGTHPSDQPLPQRTFKLLMMHSGTMRLMYLSVTDDEKLYLLLLLGEALGDERVRCDIDRFARMHVLMPQPTKLFYYYQIGPEGKIIDAAVYRVTTSSPRLVRDPDSGDLHVAGGAEALPGVDYRESPLPGITPVEL